MEYFGDIKNYFVGSFILLILDLAWLTLFMNKKFGGMVFRIQGDGIKLNLMAGVVAYFLLGLGVTYFGINRVNPDDPFVSSMINGGLLGLVIYGVFDFTNMAIFKNYELGTALIDTLWGVFLCSTTTYLSHKFLLLLNEKNI